MRHVKPTEPSTPPARQLVFRHASKCGGTFLRRLLPAVVLDSRGRTSREWVEWSRRANGTEDPPIKEWRGAVWEVHDRLAIVIDRITWPLGLRTQSTKRGSRSPVFTIAAMRNPCSWYLSYYGYLPNQALHDAEPKFSRAARAAHNSSLRFGPWLRTLTLTKDIGYMSYRFWAAYLAPPECYKVPYYAAVNHERRRDKRLPSAAVPKECRLEKAVKALPKKYHNLVREQTDYYIARYGMAVQGVHCSLVKRVGSNLKSMLCVKQPGQYEVWDWAP